MNRRQRDVLVGAAVAGDEVGIEQFVVIFKIVALAVIGDGVAGIGVGVRDQIAGTVEHRRSSVGDVEQKGEIGLNGLKNAARNSFRLGDAYRDWPSCPRQVSS